jgi:hypothetical protein
LFYRKVAGSSADADAAVRERIVPPWGTAHLLRVPLLILVTALLPPLGAAK